MEAPRSRGFTLVELAFVLAVLGVLLSMSVPVYERTLRRAQAAEARVMMEHVAHAELAWHRDHGRYRACAPSPAEVPRGTTAAFDEDTDGWRDLGISMGSAVRFRYAVEAGETTFRVIAEADLDGDGATSRWVLDGRDLGVTATDPLE